MFASLLSHLGPFVELLAFGLSFLIYRNQRDSVIVKFDVLESADTIPGLGYPSPEPGIYAINRKRHETLAAEVWAEGKCDRWRRWHRLRNVEFRNEETKIETELPDGIHVHWDKAFPRKIPPDRHAEFPTSCWSMDLKYTKDIRFVRGALRYDLNKIKRSKAISIAKLTRTLESRREQLQTGRV